MFHLKRFYIVIRNIKQISKCVENDIRKLCETLRHEILYKFERKTIAINFNLINFEIETLCEIEMTKFNNKKCDNVNIISKNDINEYDVVVNYFEKKNTKNIELLNIMIVDSKTFDLSKIWNFDENDESDNDIINNMF